MIKIIEQVSVSKVMADSLFAGLMEHIQQLCCTVRAVPMNLNGQTTGHGKRPVSEVSHCPKRTVKILSERTNLCFRISKLDLVTFGRCETA